MARQEQQTQLTPLRRKLEQLPPFERDRVIIELIVAEIVDVLGHPTTDVDPGRPFTELGVESQAAVELYSRLVEATGLEVPTSTVFSYPTPRALAGFLREELEGKSQSNATSAASRPSLGEPIAIVGIGCRFPGGISSAEQLWQLVHAGRDAIGDPPVDRGWDAESVYADSQDPQSSCTYRGGFLEEAADFDPAFFGIGPREALAMDPQQRLLLQTAWEAVEDAGIDPTALMESRAGVFIGIALHDYEMLLQPLRTSLQGHLATGTATSVASGRIAYVMGLQGPSLTLDTACSSSLVAIHQACLALRIGQCSAALAGGATVMATPNVIAEFSHLGALSQRGRCSSFAAEADGTAFGEGAGVLMLERLSDALSHGRRILAVVRGSATGSDGASNGLTAPNGRAQQNVIREALAEAELSAADVDVVEAHGTGTALGDPIEADALLATYGQEHSAAHPLYLGSLKSNIGHTQAAAGVAGVIKMVMALRHQELPQTLHVDEPSPNVDWSSGKVALLTERTTWPKQERPRRAAVSAFGVSGTNAHLILEEAPASSNTEDTGRGPSLSTAPWILSAKTADSLVAQAERLRTYVVDHPEAEPLDIAFSLATTRPSFRHRAAVVGETRDAFLDGLSAISSRRPAPNVVQATASSGRRLAFLLTGQGSQRPEMGKALYDSFPAFADALDATCACIDAHLDRAIRDIMFAGVGSPESRLLEATGYTQPALFTLEVALFRLLESWGLHPDYLIGHSIGELTAAHVAGVLSLPDASKLVVARASLMQSVSQPGAMVAVEASEEEVTATLAGSEGLAIAAINGPQSIVVSGDEDAAEDWMSSWKRSGGKARRLRVSHAFHSHHMEAMLDDFSRVAAEVELLLPQIPIVSTVSGTVSDVEITSPDYWVRQVRMPVRFLAGMRWLAAQKVATYLELGPGDPLSALAHSCLTTGNVDASQERELVITPAIGAGGDEAATLLRAITELHTHGITVNWHSIFTDQHAERLQLPTYPFVKQRFWPEFATTGWIIDQPPGVESSLAADLSAADQPPALHTSQDLALKKQSEELLVEVIRSAAAAALGYSSASEVDIETSFLELGLSSLGATKVAQAVMADFGMVVPVALLRDNPTVRSLASELLVSAVTTIETTPRTDIGSPNESLPTETLTATAHHALQNGRGKEFIELIATAARLQHTQDTNTGSRRRRTTLITRGSSPQLICIPSFVAGSGPHQFLRIGASAEYSHTLTALSLPGFRRGEALPSSRQALINELAGLILDAAGEEPFALLGYSSGGAVAHAVIERLEEGDVLPSAFLLLDVYEPLRDELPDVFATVLAQLVGIDHAFVALTDSQLLAMGAYIGLFEDWVPQTLGVPSILLRATSPLHTTLSYPVSIPAWQHAISEVELPGNHFSIIDSDAGTTAQVLQEALRSSMSLSHAEKQLGSHRRKPAIASQGS